MAASPSDNTKNEKDMKRLSGKVAIVTGGGSGIGAGIVNEFRRQGAVTIAADLTITEPTQFDRHLDVTQEQEWAILVEEGSKRLRP